VEEQQVRDLPFEEMWLQAQGPLAVLDVNGITVEVNPAMCRMLGAEREQLLGIRAAEVVHPADLGAIRKNIEQLVEKSVDPLPVEIRLLHSSGRVMWGLIQPSLVRTREGEPRYLVYQVLDISELRALQLLWRRTMSNAPIGMGLMSLDGRWTEINDQVCDMVGHGRDVLLGRPFSDLVDDPDDKRALQEALTRLQRDEETSVTLEARLRHALGHTFWMLIRLIAIPGPDDRPAYLVGQCESLGGGDVRISQDRFAELTRMALHDPLTGLANRTLLVDRLEDELGELESKPGVLAVMVIDVDGLKPVNDQFGHRAGNEMLKAVSEKLTATVRSQDTVARIGGDEFVVLTKVGTSEEAEVMRQRLRSELVTDVAAVGQLFQMSASVGLATTRDPEASVSALLAKADLDMYRAKRSRSGA